MVQAHQAVQALGGAGFLNDSVVSRLFRDAKLMEIGAGTSEIRRMLIGRELGGVLMRLPTKAQPSSEAFGPTRHASGQARRGPPRRESAALGGGKAACERHVARGKLLPRDRVANLLDAGSPFLEIGAIAAQGMYDGAAPGAGLIAGVGRVEGREVMVVCNDATVKGGTYYPMTVKKHLRAQEIAEECRLPCIYLVDSAARTCPTRTRSFPTATTSGASSSTRRG
jgi:hypothetical protein